MEFKTVNERLAEALQRGRPEDDRQKEISEIVGSIATRMYSSIDRGLADLAELQEKKARKVERAWESIAVQGIAAIEQEGSLAPGLSHQELYIKDLQEAAKNAATVDEFLSNLDKLIATWGSRMKYPLYAGGRRKQLENLRQVVKREAGAEKKRVRISVEHSFAGEIERLQGVTKDNVDSAAVELRAVMIDALAWKREAERVIQLRYEIIDGMINQILAKMAEKVGTEHAAYRDFLYYALERVLRAVYESFQHVVTNATKRMAARASDSAIRFGATLPELTDREIYHARIAAAKLEARINSQSLNSVVISEIRNGLKTGVDSVSTDPKAFAEICAGLRSDQSFNAFQAHVRRVPGIEEFQREEVIAAIKTAVEPFRSIYYAKITTVRYLKGLKIFKEKIAATPA